MYVFAFATAFLLYRRQVRERRFPMGEDQIYSLIGWAILGLILGARLFSVLIYEGSDYYILRPWLIFWPFRGGTFVGLQGMSYHGGAVGGFLAIVLYCKVRRFSFREVGDMLAASIPLGYTFGRLGNFTNGELYGRATTSPIGMVFPDARRIPANTDWVIDAAEQTGSAIVNGMVNLPRHPSQLYQMLLEGIVLWCVIWFLRNRKPFKGFLIGLYFVGYGLFRFVIEYFREPDPELGFILEFGTAGLPTYARPLLSFSTGQILCFLMILFGVAWMLITARLKDSRPLRVYPESGSGEPEKTPEEKAAERNRERNRRRKLKQRLK